MVQHQRSQGQFSLRTMQATMTKLLTYGVLRLTQPPILGGMEMSSLYATQCRIPGGGQCRLVGAVIRLTLASRLNCPVIQAQDGSVT